MIDIRPETKEDYPAVYQVNRLAFGRDNEARLVEALRRAEGHIPELSLVAVESGQVVGHVLFSPTPIETEDGPRAAISLAPVAVLPERQNQGIGSALIRHGLEECRRLGHKIVIVLGHAGYYPRFGFTPARAKGVAPPFEVADEHWMALELQPGALEGVQGTVRYPPAFDEV